MSFQFIYGADAVPSSKKERSYFRPYNVALQWNFERVQLIPFLWLFLPLVSHLVSNFHFAVFGAELSMSNPTRPSCKRAGSSERPMETLALIFDKGGECDSAAGRRLSDNLSLSWLTRTMSYRFPLETRSHQDNRYHLGVTSQLLGSGSGGGLADA